MPTGWFRKRPQAPAARAGAENVPEGLWTKCLNPECQELLFTRELERNLKVCPKCNFHFPLSAAERIDLLLDPNSFVERDSDLVSTNPLQFENYNASLTRYQNATGMREGVLSGEGTINARPLTIAVTDSRFLMGSMASVVGERITRAVERATEQGVPTVLISGSGGGARMQEGLLSLMQMAKTSGALARHHEAGLLAVVILTSPSMAGVLASWGSLGDVNLAEAGAMIGFVGKRVSQQAGVHRFPADYQTAEFQQKHGQVDKVCQRREMRETLARIMEFAGAPVAAPAAEVTHAR